MTGLLLYNQQEYREAATIPYVYQGLVGRVTYGYKKRYLGEFNVGYNGSENFVKGKRFGLFPAFSLGWVLSEEPFLKDSKAVTWLKIRGSYGEVGNDKLYINGVLRRFLYYSDYSQNNSGYIFGQGGVFSPSITEGRIGNNNVTWERARKANIGVEANFWGSKLAFVGDFFFERRSDILIAQDNTVPNTSGAILPAVNKGKTQNKGFELELSHSNRINDFSYQIKANYSFSRNKVLFVDEPTSIVSWQKSEGKPIGQPLLYRNVGLFLSEEDLAYYPAQTTLGSTIVGDCRYLDYNGDGVIDKYDAFRQGYSTIPEINYGFTISFQYKGLDFSALFQGVDHVMLNINGAYVKDVRNYWSPFKSTTENLAATSPTPHETEAGEANNNQPSWGKFGTYVSGEYLKLRNVQIGYTLPNRFTRKLGISSIRFYCNGSNLAILHAKMKYVDPESSSGDGYFYPQMRVINLGVNISF